MPNKVTWFEIIGGDTEILHKFYAELFDWNVDANNEMNYGVVSPEQAGVGGGIGPAFDESPGYVTIYIGVDDIHDAIARVEELGGATVMPPTELAEFGMTFALIADPQGHVVGLTQNA